jgi:predicted unusual protein kinase regulating ubiquinone biosynthesis (AarF/ABC1/UbiB family)
MWGMNMSQMVVVGYQEMRRFAGEFRDLLYDMPFQVPQNLIYLGRAAGILSGMCTSLHPEFNPWTALAPHARKLVSEELQMTAGTWLDQVRGLLALPRMAESFFRQTERGELQVRAAPETEMRRLYHRIELAIHQVALAIVIAVLAGAGTILLLNGENVLGLVGLVLSGITLGAFLWRSFRGA